MALAARIAELVEKFKLDLLHVHYAIPHAYAAVNAQQILLEKNIAIPIVTTLHGTDITLVGKSPFVLSAVNYAINKSSLVTCVSESLKLDTLRYFDIYALLQMIIFVVVYASLTIKYNFNILVEFKDRFS